MGADWAFQLNFEGTNSWITDERRAKDMKQSAGSRIAALTRGAQVRLQRGYNRCREAVKGRYEVDLPGICRLAKFDLRCLGCVGTGRRHFRPASARVRSQAGLASAGTCTSARGRQAGLVRTLGAQRSADQ